MVYGGPNGGDGGKGGDVWLVADRNVASLLAFRDHPHRRAGNGVHGKGKDLHGKRGADLEIRVPEGTVVRDLYSGEVLADLVGHGDRWMAAAGGRGGRGNAKFLSNRRRAPSFAEQGEHGEERWLKLELKLMADVALVGFPNAGKSTFISAVSAAKPKMADYPFTTLEPHLGVVRLDDGFEMVVADIPGLIEGASEGRGLGHQFLRHVERARVLCVLVDLASVEAISPQEQEEVLLHELGAYRPDLLERPRVVVGDQGRRRGVPDGTACRCRRSPGRACPRCSARSVALVEEARAGRAALRRASSSTGPRRRAWRSSAWASTSSGCTGGRPCGPWRSPTCRDAGALAYADHRLKRSGVDKALARAGAAPGDVVHVGEFSFDYEPDL